MSKVILNFPILLTRIKMFFVKNIKKTIFFQKISQICTNVFLIRGEKFKLLAQSL